jgi:putative DNA primase/helicase
MIESYLEVVKKQTNDYSLSIEKFSWIIFKENEKGECNIIINTSLLIDYLRKKNIFLFVKKKANDGILTFMWHKGYYKHVDDIDIKTLIIKYIPLELQKSSYSREGLELLYTTVQYTNEIDLNPEKYINFRDCLFNIQTWETEEHHKSIFSTVRIDCDCPYNSEIKKPDNSIFDRYINDLSEGNEEKKSLILQFIGVTLSNVPGFRMKKALFMVGSGDTGKSQVKELTARLIGQDYYNSMDLKELEERFATSQIYNKRLVGSNDMSYVTVKELKTFKKIVGGDTIQAEYKGKNGFSFIFSGVVWFCCNKLPKFGGDKGEWVYNRIIPLQCNNVIPKEKQIKNLIELMLKEKEYIIFLALEQLKRVIANNYEYIIPEESKQTLKEYKTDNNSFANFFEECCIDRPVPNKIQDSCTRAKLYKVYNAWCKENNNGYKETKTECLNFLSSIRKEKTKNQTGYCYFTDFTLNRETKENYFFVYGYDSVEKS